jgi:cation transport regulator ChaB
MPYETLPERLRAIIPSKAGQDIFRNTVNSQLAAGKSEEVAMASAWAALQRAGYDKDENGNWTAKMQPTASQVHVPGTEWDDEEKGKKPKDYYKGEEVEKKTYQPPESARNNARRVLEWKEKHGDEVKGMTSVGWARARQLASGKPVSRDTVARMSAFARHRQNAEVAAEYKSTPWKDRGYVAWLGWGGSAGVNWAGQIMSSLTKRMMNDDTFTTSAEAAVRSMDLGLDGEVHVHQTADGQAVYMPGASHAAYLERMADLAGIRDSLLDDAEDSTQSSPDLLQRVISAILAATMEHSVAKASDILKVDKARRIVWGWASVSTMKGELVTDRQGDRIAPAEMEKMADGFMRSARAAKAMHDGDDVGEVIHSLPLTKELADALGIQTDREGWITGTYVKSDAEWQKVLRGEYAGLSIGGRAKRKERSE